MTPKPETSDEKIAADLAMIDSLVAYNPPPGAPTAEQQADLWLLGSRLGLCARPVPATAERAADVIDALERALSDSPKSVAV